MDLDQNLDFVIPPSTQQIIVWIQDSACRTNSKIPLSRFKARQNCPNGNLKRRGEYGEGTKIYDENLQSIQLTVADITKPSTQFQTSNGAVTTRPDVSITMLQLQRYLMTNQNQQR
jgi:hypothetical protein